MQFHLMIKSIKLMILSSPKNEEFNFAKVIQYINLFLKYLQIEITMMMEL